MQDDPPPASDGTERTVAPRAWPSCRSRWRRSTLLLLLCAAPRIASAEDLVTDDPNKVKAAFLRHFAHYVTWPPQAFPDAGAPWCIGVVGDDPFGPLLEKTLQGRAEQGRSFSIRRAASVRELPACHIVYLAIHSSAERQAALASLKGRPVLTVGEAPEFLQEGGIILLQVDGRVTMSVNLDEARGASLEVNTKMLEVSIAVLENGQLRRVR